jgi:hypothetical protein
MKNGTSPASEGREGGGGGGGGGGGAYLLNNDGTSLFSREVNAGTVHDITPLSH